MTGRALLLCTLLAGGLATAANDPVLALWEFESGAELADASGNGHTLKLRGQARVVKSGRSGGGLESFPAGQGNDKAQGAITVKKHPDLSPQGAFTLELWLRPKPTMAEQRTVFLLDSKYYPYPKDLPRANTGYMFYLRRSSGGWTPVAALGYGKDSAEFAARPVSLEAGAWRHLAFTYDGAGAGRILLDGKDIGGTTHAGRGSIAPAFYPLTIGDRYGSTHGGCAAILDEVRISKGVQIGGLSIQAGTRNGRTAFHRMEQVGPLRVVLTNHTDKPLSDMTVRVTFAGEWVHHIPVLRPRTSHAIDVFLDTRLRPDRYELGVAVKAKAGVRTLEADHTQSIVIVPRPLPHVMPVVMWGSGDFERLKAMGFTHHIQYAVDYAAPWETGQPVAPGAFRNVQAARENLDRHLAAGLGVVYRLDPGRWLERKGLCPRVDRTGKPYNKAQTCASLPKVQQFGHDVGASLARAVGDFPAFQSVLIHTEIRGHTAPCFHDSDRAAFRKATGADVPREISGRTPPRYDGLPAFPADRVVPDDHPLLVYYRWFWRDGDGWNPLHGQVSRGLHSTGRDDLWTFYDPAVRVPSLWGSGGAVDVISQWTYVYPDPIKIGQATDELFAMAAGRPGQRVMKMTQAIWYRRQTAPELPKDESRKAPWEKRIPDARFVTIAPDHLREALWCKLARPVRGIMYHGWGSLAESPHGSYRFTNPETPQVLGQLVRDVVRPLGPTLLQVPDRPADVAILQSFTSQMFAHRGSWGWSSSWEADVHLILQWAQLQPRIVFEETILRDGLDGVRVLVLPHCDVLTESVAKAIAAFQRAGGILVADEHLAPRLNPDILLPTYKRTQRAAEDKRVLQARAAALRRELDTVYTRYAESSNPDVVVRCRRYGSADYLFAINDRRTFGTYVGHHGRVMEKGLPCAATITVRRPASHVYDLVAHRPVETEQGATRFPVALGPGEGRVFLIAPSPIAGLRVEAPESAKLGGPVRLDVAIVDDGGKPVGAVVPVQVEALDPQGRAAEFSGAYGARNGQLSVTVDLATNDAPGDWTIRVRDLASGRVREQRLIVRP